jgi:hypothetical protein
MNRLILQFLIFSCLVNFSNAQVGVKFNNLEVSDFTSSMKSPNFTYLLWDRNHDGEGIFTSASRPTFFYWDNDESKFSYLIDTRNMDFLNAKFFSTHLSQNLTMEGKMGIGTETPRSVIDIYSETSFPGIRFENYVDFTGKYWNHEMKVGQGGFSFYFGSSATKNSNASLRKGSLLIGENGVIFDNGSFIMKSNPGQQIGSTAYGVMVDISKVYNYIKLYSENFLVISPNFKVDLDGFLYARQIEVKATGNFPDYVFYDDYKLRNLEEVESFIQENQHLPEVPSAKEIEENGHNLAQMDEILLKKVEELTLYIIELKKENEKLSNRMAALEQKGKNK